MRFTLPVSFVCAAIAMVAFGFDAAPGTPAAAPTTAPIDVASTQPALFSVRGHVGIAAGLDQAQIDMSHVVVYLDSDPVLDATALSNDHPSIAQKNKEFVPKFLAVAKGTSIEFPNFDHISHNVFSRSAAAPAFDLDRYPYGVSKTRTFTKVGTVQLFCNIHPQMRAMVFVTPNPFLSRADKDGKFTIVGIPAGHYTLVAWHDRCVTIKQPIEVGNNSPDKPVEFSLAEDRNDILTNNPPAHAEAYGTERGLGIKHEKLNLPVVTESHPATTADPCPDCK